MPPADITADESSNHQEAAAKPAGVRLQNLPSRRRLTGEEAAARSKMVRRLRIALPILALAMIGVFFLNAGQDTAQDVFLDEFQDVSAEADELHVARPRFSGIDASGNPYDITAATAVRLPGEVQLMELVDPQAITTDDGRQSTLTADTGAFNDKEKQLILRENVRFERNIGNETYVLRTAAATFNIDEEQVASDVGVEGDGPDGASLSAERLIADNKSGSVILEGNVRMRFYPKSKNNSNTPQENQPACAQDDEPCLR